MLERFKWPLLLVLAAAGLWFFGDRLYDWRPAGDRSYEAGALSFSVSADSSRVRLEGLPRAALRYLRGRPADLSGVIRVYALPEGGEWDDSVIPAEGSRRVTGEGIEFTARHEWLPEVSYYVRVDRGRLGEMLDDPTAEGVVDTSFILSRPAGLEPERVTGVYPSADTLPQNLLKFYIHFSGPMSRDGVYRHISIRNARGEVVPDAFLELPQELWDPDAERLTILFDPGRIKRGLERHNLMGVAFEPGRRYSLVVDSAMRDANGLPLGEDYRKRFTVTEADREMPDHERWRVESPAAGTRDPLRLHLDEPLDRALLLRLVSVYREGAEAEVEGEPGTREGERVWTFVPDEPWLEGSYRIRIGRVIEDLAGNNLVSVFDVDLSDSVAPDERARPGVEADSPVVKHFEISGR